MPATFSDAGALRVLPEEEEEEEEEEEDEEEDLEEERWASFSSCSCTMLRRFVNRRGSVAPSPLLTAVSVAELEQEGTPASSPLLPASADHRARAEPIASTTHRISAPSSLMVWLPPPQLPLPLLPWLFWCCCFCRCRDDTLLLLLLLLLKLTADGLGSALRAKLPQPAPARLEAAVAAARWARPREAAPAAGRIIGNQQPLRQGVVP